MAMQPARRVAASLVLIVTLIASTFGAAAQASTGTGVWLDGTALGAIAIDRPGKEPLIELTPLARALDWSVTGTNAGARLEGHDRSLTLQIGARTIRENGDLRAMFAEPPIERNARIYLNARDAARLLGLSFSGKPKIEFHRPVDLSTDTQIVEVPAPPTPHPVPTPRPIRQLNNGGLGSSANQGRVVLSLDRSGGVNVLSIDGETQGSYLQTRLNSTGIDDIGTPNATVIVGDAKKNASLGYISDPIGGLVLSGGVYEGVDLHENRLDGFVGRRLDNGFSSFGAVLGENGGTTDTIDVLTRGTAYAETMLRRFAVWYEPWGIYRSEYIFSDKGFGIGFSSRTRGKTFFESTVTYATPGLPLGPNDAPIRFDVGRDLSPATTVVAGLSTNPQSPLGPYLGISTHADNLLAGLSLTNHQATASLAYRTPTVDLQGYTVPGDQRATGLQGTVYFPNVVLDVESIDAVGDQESFAEVRTNRPGINFVTGVGVPYGGHAGPIGGLSLPVNSTFSLEGTLRPSAGGPYRLHLGIAAAIRPRNHGPHEVTVPASIQLEGIPPSSTTAVRLFVDDVPAGTQSAASFSLPVTKGVHRFSAETTDGTLGAPETTVNVQAAGDTVALALIPERAVRGHVAIDPSAITPPGFSLGGIVVLIEPGDITAETNPDGTFFFPRQPVAPNATIAIDPGALPRGLHAAAPISVPNGDVMLTIFPGLPVERKSF